VGVLNGAQVLPALNDVVNDLGDVDVLQFDDANPRTASMRLLQASE
jgi:hypothetical protein